MCTPALLIGIGGGASALSSISAGNYADKIGGFNQSALNKQADSVLDAGKVAEQSHRTSVTNLKGQQKTGFAASGVDIGSGSPVDILSDTAAFGELDASTIRHNAELDAYGLRVKGESERLQGKLSKRSGFGNAAGTILTTAGSVAAL